MPLYNIITSVSLCAEFLTRPRLLPTNILPALIKSVILKKTIEALHNTTFPQGFSVKRKKNNIPMPTTWFAIVDATLYRQNKQTTGLLSPPHKQNYFFIPIPKRRSTLLRRLRLNYRSMIAFLKINCS